VKKIPVKKRNSQLLRLAIGVCSCLALFSWDVECLRGAELRTWIRQFEADEKTFAHRFRTPLDEAAHQRQLDVRRDWKFRLEHLDFDALDRDNQIDYLLLRTEVDYRINKQVSDWTRDQRASALMPYSAELVEFCRTREDVRPIAPDSVASLLDRLANSAEKVARELQRSSKEEGFNPSTQQKLDALRAAELVGQLKSRTQEAHRFYTGYHPEYTWWAEAPMKRLDRALDLHRRGLQNYLVGVPEEDKETIVGLPIGAEGLKAELEHEWIAHSPDELIEIARREMEWCDAEMEKASRELGFGDDWRRAMDHVKGKHVAPGEQPQMIKRLAWEAIRFLESNDLLTVPPLAADGWRMTMMSPERQRMNPYFLGGDTIIVSFPTNTMTHEEKLMSMRSNNEHFSRATVHHELIPGHHLQYYMLPRNRPYRAMFSTPFWIEGWALYWEMLLWDLNFAHGPEDRVGMLFWRKHRCARIIFSLGYHLGEMTPEECIEYLVDRVGHERSAATAEVRRSIMGGYSPLYQAAYMLGGLQLRKMHAEQVLSGKETNRQFHDRILEQHAMPIEVLRLALTDQPLGKNQKASWRFGDSGE